MMQCACYTCGVVCMWCYVSVVLAVLCACGDV